MPLLRDIKNFGLATIAGLATVSAINNYQITYKIWWLFVGWGCCAIGMWYHRQIKQWHTPNSLLVLWREMRSDPRIWWKPLHTHTCHNCGETRNCTRTNHTGTYDNPYWCGPCLLDRVPF